MKLQTKSFKRALEDVSRVIKTRTTLPWLQCVRLTCTDDDMLTIEGSNGDAWITRKVERADFIESVLVNHHRIAQMVSLATSDSIELLLNEAGTKLTLKAGRSVSLLNTLDAKEFISDPISEAKPLAVVANDLADGIHAVLWAASREEALGSKYLNVVIDLQSKMLNCVATQGRVVAHFARPLICEERTFTVPASLISLIVDSMREKGAQVYLSEKMLSVTHDSGSASVKRSTENPLPYRNITDLRGKGEASMVNRDFLRRACSISSSMSDIALSASVTLSKTDSGVSAEVMGAKDEWSEEIDAFIVQDEFSMTLAAKYLDPALALMEAPEVGIYPLSNVVFVESGDLSVAISRMVKTKPEEVAK